MYKQALFLLSFCGYANTLVSCNINCFDYCVNIVINVHTYITHAKTPNALQNCDILINSSIYVHDDNYINIMHRRSHIIILIIITLSAHGG